MEAHIQVPMRIVIMDVKATFARSLMAIDWRSRRAAIRKEEKISEKLVKKEEKARERTVKCWVRKVLL